MIHGHASEDASSADQAREDARKMQTLVSKQCNDAGQPSPPYQLLELIGKGSFGRVYKAARERTLVAVKIGASTRAIPSSRAQSTLSAKFSKRSTH